MSAGPFVIEILCVFIATLYVLHQYGNIKKQHFLVTLAVFISWFFSFLIVFILPLDVSNTFYQDCVQNNENSNNSFKSTNCIKPWSSMSGNVLPNLWRTIYWSSQILSWLLLPMMQSYVYAGAFTIWGKLKTALYENALWYGSYLVIFGGLLIYVALKPDLALNAESLKLIGITASNTWGLLLLILLLGYGLVELPRKAWNMTLPNLRLEQTYFRIAKLSTEREDADEELSECLTEVRKASEEIKYNSNLRQYIDTVIAKCPPESVEMFSKGTDDFVDYKQSSIAFTEKVLVKLHRQVIVLTHRAHRCHVQWNSELKSAFFLEDLEKSKSNPEKIFKNSFANHVSPSRLKLKFKWYWEITIKPWLFRFLALILLVLSVLLVWSEMTFFSTDPVLSVYALLIKVSSQDYQYIPIEIVSCITIAYMCACTYYTVFKMKFFNFYYFARNHQTDANSLLFSGLLLCRLTYALCLNFLAIIHLDGHVTGTSKNKNLETDFTQFMGHMDLLSFIAKGFNVYYPMIVLIVCLCTYFSLGKRLLHCIGMEQFLTDDDFSADYVREGREIAKREKRRIERECKTGMNWKDRGEKLKKKYNKFDSVRNRDSQRIDDTDSDIVSPPSSQAKYNPLASSNDKIQLLSDVEYAPPADSPQRSLAGYEKISGSSRASRSGGVPRNIFDDA